jgi:chromate reductase
MATIVGIAGSLRKGSFNASLLRAAAELAPAGLTVDIASIAGIPLYDGDVEAEHGIPDAVAQLKERIAQAAGLVIVTPEYNNSMPGVLKNAIDWLSRPNKDIARVFGQKPVAMLGASSSVGGTALAQNAWLPTWRVLGTQAWFGGRALIANAGKVFDAEGKLIDDAVRGQVEKFMAGFAEFVERHGKQG